MRVNCLLLLFFINVCTFAQTKVVSANAKPLITPFGQPVGDSVIKRIDTKGGIVKSADGKFEVIFPADAVDTETFVSMRPIHNQLTEDDDGSYQLEPSGIIFKKPVQLVFHYADGNEAADLKSVAWQDDKGQWHRLRSTVTDTIQKTITASTIHFSRWAKFSRLYIDPSSTSVKVNKTVRLMIREYGLAPTSSDNDDELLAPPAKEGNDDGLLATPGMHPNFYTSDWTVNGIVNGKPEIGTLKLNENKNSYGAEYKAPAVVPDNNPVAVSVQIYSDQPNKKLLLTSNITVIGGKYHFTYIHIDEGDGCFALVDSSSCIVNLETENPTITDIINYPPWSDWPNCSKACKTEWTNKESVKGLVEINGLATSKITPPAKKGGVTGVFIELVPAMGNTASAIEHCKDGDHKIPSQPVPADPKYISFDIIDRDNLMIHFGGKSGTNDLVVQGRKEKTMIYMYRVN